jgi:hypothetical protein
MFIGRSLHKIAIHNSAAAQFGNWALVSVSIRARARAHTHTHTHVSCGMRVENARRLSLLRARDHSLDNRGSISLFIFAIARFPFFAQFEKVLVYSRRSAATDATRCVSLD